MSGNLNYKCCWLIRDGALILNRAMLGARGEMPWSGAASGNRVPEGGRIHDVAQDCGQERRVGLGPPHYVLQRCQAVLQPTGQPG